VAVPAEGGQHEREDVPPWGGGITALARISTPYVDILTQA
jgi:hypothetical protein